jgi:integrase
MALTALQIKHAKEGMHADGSGLYLRVQASGAKSWIFRFQLNNKRREMGIGTLAAKPAPEARSEAAQLAAMIRNGIDPIEDRKAKAELVALESQKTAAAVTTFRQVATAYIDNHRASWKNAKHAQQWENTLEQYAGPIIGDKPVGEITTEEILSILQPLWITKTETASRLRSRIELVLSYAKALKLRHGENPAIWRGHLDAILPKESKVKKIQHQPALPYLQIADFMKKLRTTNGSGARALEFGILTATRSSEVRLAEWSEIDFETKLWTIPAVRMKAKREHWVPLSHQAIKLLENLPRVEEDKFIFVGTRDKRPLSDMTLSAVIRRFNDVKDGQTPPWIDPSNDREVVPHGFRSTFRDWAAEVGHYPRELAEHALAHSLPDKVEAAYQRGTMLERRRPMMQAWSDYTTENT